eukprot:COSAG05_NODE_2354_length_3191_cov_2.052584_3_plen_127_part_00
MPRYVTDSTDTVCILLCCVRSGAVGSSQGSATIAARNITVKGLVQGGLSCTESADWPVTCPGSHSNVTSDAKLLFMAHYLAVPANGVLQAGSVLICPFSNSLRPENSVSLQGSVKTRGAFQFYAFY